MSLSPLGLVLTDRYEQMAIFMNMAEEEEHHEKPLNSKSWKNQIYVQNLYLSGRKAEEVKMTFRHSQFAVSDGHIDIDTPPPKSIA